MKSVLKSLLVILVTLSVAISCIKDEVAEFELRPGDSLPDFSVTMNDGSVVTGASLRKDVSLIMFFHTSCPDCQQTLPSVELIYGKYREKGVSFALVSRAQGDDEIAPYWEQQKYTVPYSAQEDRSVYNLFATSRVPRVYISKNGIIHSVFTDDPVPSYEDLLGAIDACL